MDLTRKTETLGQSVDTGLLTLDQAIQELTAFSAGRLTDTGARDMIQNWESVRVRYMTAFRRAEDGLRKQG